ncbi:MAG: redoxin domain-containing protein [Sphingobacteriales bacterium]|nr:MAG: redoxin domain-containing protein [Sphingobacteriales bacterium]
MKKLFLAAACSLVSVAAMAQSQSLPSTTVKDMSTGSKVAFNQAFKPGRITMVNFWATWCVPCKKEIKNVRAKLPEWRKQADFDYMTVSIDESRAEGLVRSYAVSQGWDFQYFIDPNSDLKRSLNFQNVPFTIVVGKDGKVAYMHSGYEEGGENEVFAKILELSK